MIIPFENEETAIDKDVNTKFPDKPLEGSKEQSIRQSVISLVLFIGAFYLIFKWDFTYILVLAGVLLLHEIGHYLAMRVFKYKDLGIFFIPLLGAFSSGSKTNISQKQNVIILLSGPLPGVIIGLILYYYGLRDENEFLIRTSNIFIFLNLFNLLPIMPLDGGRIIKSMIFENNEIINKIFIFISIAVLTLYSLSSHSYFLLIIPILLILQLSTYSQIKNAKRGISEKGIRIDKSFEELTNEEYWIIRDEIGTHIKSFARFITPKSYIVSDYENRIIKQVRSIVQKKPTKDLGIGGKILITMIWISSFLLPLIAIIIYYNRLGIKLQ